VDHAVDLPERVFRFAQRGFDVFGDRDVRREHDALAA
jgi:hypothetical protein